MKTTPKDEFLLSLEKIKEYRQNQEVLNHAELYERLKDEFEWSMSYSSFYRLFQKEFSSQEEILESQNIEIIDEGVIIQKYYLEKNQLQILEKLEFLATQIEENAKMSLNLKQNTLSQETQIDKKIVESFEMQKSNFEDMIVYFEENIDKKIKNLNNFFDKRANDKIFQLKQEMELLTQTSQSKIEDATNINISILSRKINEFEEILEKRYGVFLISILFGMCIGLLFCIFFSK
jgi:hypothetical protein